MCATFNPDRYPSPAADSVIFMIAMWGISQLLMSLVYIVILWRYNSLISFACLLFSFEYIFRLMLSFSKLSGKKIKTDGQAPGGIGNFVFVPLGLFLFWYSLPNL